jgi:hypothetical protein
MHEAVKGEVQSLPQEAVIPLATTQRPRSVSARPISTDVNRRLHSNSAHRRMRNGDFQSCERENISHPMNSAEAISRIISVKS